MQSAISNKSHAKATAGGEGESGTSGARRGTTGLDGDSSGRDDISAKSKNAGGERKARERRELENAAFRAIQSRISRYFYIQLERARSPLFARLKDDEERSELNRPPLTFKSGAIAVYNSLCESGRIRAIANLHPRVYSRGGRGPLTPMVSSPPLRGFRIVYVVIRTAESNFVARDDVVRHRATNDDKVRGVVSSTAPKFAINAKYLSPGRSSSP